MDNPLKIIREGILQHNLEKICNGFELLTGEKIKLEPLPDIINPLIQQIEQLLNEYKKSENRMNIKSSDLDKIAKNKEPVVFDKYKTPPLATGFSTTNKRGYYGNETKPLTENVSEEEVNKNIEKATITKERKTKRSPPKKYNIKCSQCEQNFESDRQESKDFGQKCPKCLQDTINGKVVDG